METDQRFLVRMKIIVNMIAGIAFIVQFAFSAFSMLTMQKPITINEILYNYMLLVALPCSSIIVLLFLLLYNFNYKFLNNKCILFRYWNSCIIHTCISIVCTARFNIDFCRVAAY